MPIVNTNGRAAAPGLTYLVTTTVVDNPGSLNSLLNIVSRLGINLSGLWSATPTPNTTVVTFATSNPSDARRLHREFRLQEFFSNIAEALQVSVPDSPDSFRRNVTSKLMAKKINVEQVLTGIDRLFLVTDNLQETSYILEEFAIGASKNDAVPA